MSHRIRMIHEARSTREALDARGSRAKAHFHAWKKETR